MSEQKAGFVDRMKARFAAAQDRHPALAHLVAMVQHYGAVQGNVLAGGVTYFGFLSFFPILAIAFSVVGYLSVAFPDARDSLVTGIEQIFPGIVTVDGADNTISLEQIERASATVGLIGLLGLLYAGLGWLSGLRAALTASFELPKAERRNFVVGKVIDLCVLAVLGVVLIVSVGITSTAKGLADTLLSAVGLDDTWTGATIIWTLAPLIGLAASTLLFYVMFRLLGKPDLPQAPLWQGALLAAAGFEILKILVVTVLDGVGGSAFAPLAIAVTLLVWINYFSRLVFYGASWAVTSPLAAETLEVRRQEHARELLVADKTPKEGPGEPRGDQTADAPDRSASSFDVGSALLGGAVGVVATTLLRRRG